MNIQELAKTLGVVLISAPLLKSCTRSFDVSELVQARAAAVEIGTGETIN